MFQIITHESIEPVAERVGSTGELTKHMKKTHHTENICCKLSSYRQTESNGVAVTNLFHVTAEVHTCHRVPVTLEMSLKSRIRLYGERHRQRETNISSHIKAHENLFQVSFSH